MELTQSGFFFDLPIYSPIKIDDEHLESFKDIIDGTRKKEFEGYNPWRKLESTFVVTTDLIPSHSSFLTSGGYGTINIKCKRTDDSFRFFVLWSPTTKEFMKIGQYPSVADFHISEIKQYKKLLPEEKLREFTRAIGLAANGVGIGSFVYLRRIFEFLVNEAFTKAKNDGVLDEETFFKCRMDEKLELLSHYLPDFLVSNKGMYSILSLGVHELDEKTCLAHFDTLRVGIEIILDEKLEEFRKSEKIAAAKKKLDELKGNIKK
ncbi:MAG: hypothetical protein RW306_05450 [Geobacteraceae bacterium]|nr:hypothetical protein [Geobacteraceae bacterium]